MSTELPNLDPSEIAEALMRAAIGNATYDEHPELTKLKSLSPLEVKMLISRMNVKRGDGISEIIILIDPGVAEKHGLRTDLLKNELVRRIYAMTGHMPASHDYRMMGYACDDTFVKSVNSSHDSCLLDYRDKLPSHRLSPETRSKDAIEWARRATGRDDIKDNTFFPVTALAERFGRRQLPSAMFKNGFDMKDEEIGVVMSEVVKCLQEMGIKRLGFFRQGGFSTVFETVPDKEGRVQLVTLVSEHDDIIPHPLFVPLKEVHTVEVNGRKFTVKVSPKLRCYGVRNQDVDNIDQIFTDTGLYTQDLRKDMFNHHRTHNLAFFDFDEKGKEPLLFCIDHGCCKWPCTGAERKQALIDRWKKDPQFARHYAVHEKYNGTGLENIRLIPPQPPGRTALPVLGQQPDSEAAVDHADDKGMTAYEFSRMARHAAEENAYSRTRDDSEAWRSRLRDKIKDFDPTSNPNPPHTKR